MDELLTIEQIVASGEGYDLNDLRSSAKKKNRGLVIARQIYMAISAELTNKSYRCIGSVYSKDHATVMHAKKAIADLCDTDPKFKFKFSQYVMKCKIAIANKGKTMQEVIDKAITQLPQEIKIDFDSGFTVIYKLSKVEETILASATLS